jgi:hypothetical protein
MLSQDLIETAFLRGKQLAESTEECEQKNGKVWEFFYFLSKVRMIL